MIRVKASIITWARKKSCTIVVCVVQDLRGNTYYCYYCKANGGGCRVLVISAAIRFSEVVRFGRHVVPTTRRGLSYAHSELLKESKSGQLILESNPIWKLLAIIFCILETWFLYVHKWTTHPHEKKGDTLLLVSMNDAFNPSRKPFFCLENAWFLHQIKLPFTRVQRGNGLVATKDKRIRLRLFRNLIPSKKPENSNPWLFYRRFLSQESP